MLAREIRSPDTALRTKGCEQMAQLRVRIGEGVLLLRASHRKGEFGVELVKARQIRRLAHRRVLDPVGRYRIGAVVQHHRDVGEPR